MANKRRGSISDVLEPWVKSQQGFSQKTSVQMGVYFSGGDAFMSQHFLNSSQVGPSLYQMGGKGMPECMWGYVFLNIGFLGKVFNDIKYHYS